MKKIIRSLSFIIAAIVLVSCQKDFTPDSGSSIISNPANTAAFRVKTYTEADTIGSGNSSVTFNLSYDANGRVLTMIDTANAGNKFVYSYGATFYTMDQFAGGLPDIHEVFYLNTFPFTDSTFQFNSTQDTTTEKYIFNTGGKVTQIRYFDYSTVTGAVLTEKTNMTYDANGNILTETETVSGFVYNYQYFTFLNTLNMGLIYLPPNKNLVKKTTVTDSGITYTANHTYTFDSLNRITGERQVWDTGEIIVRSYTY